MAIHMSDFISLVLINIVFSIYLRIDILTFSHHNLFTGVIGKGQKAHSRRII